MLIYCSWRIETSILKVGKEVKNNIIRHVYFCNGLESSQIRQSSLGSLPPGTNHLFVLLSYFLVFSCYFVLSLAHFSL